MDGEERAKMRKIKRSQTKNIIESLDINKPWNWSSDKMINEMEELNQVKLDLKKLKTSFLICMKS